MRTILDTFDRRFHTLYERSSVFLSKLNDSTLFKRPRELPNSMAMFSCGEYILRSAAAVEQTFGGITTKLWDDPFEWTLPEKLSTTGLVQGYLDEVEETRIKGFTFFAGDEDLTRQMPAPEKLLTIHEILLDTVARAEHFQGRAFSLFQVFSDEKLPRID